MWKLALAFFGAAGAGVLAVVAVAGPQPNVTPAAPAFATSHEPPRVGKSPWNETFFPNVPVVTHDGRTLNFYDDLIRDKIVVVNFIYTSCSNICPLVTSRLALVKELLGERFGRDIFFVSITIDPVNDGPDVLRSYARTFRASPGWSFITGTPDNMEIIRTRLGERSDVKAEHRNDIMIGNDRTGTWGRDSAFTNTDILANTILGYDPKLIQPVAAPEAISPDVEAALTSLADQQGTYLFVKACSGCHSIGHGDIVGPDLAHLLARRDHAWLRRFLREPDRMRAERDPLTIELDQRYPGARMPNLGLSNSDIDDLFAYLARQDAALKSDASVSGVRSEKPNVSSH
ncbi:MAG: SCO family protein [Hyphomicrobium sp.]|nr:SCO family protein [Hyphomicrobium sp.]